MLRLSHRPVSPSPWPGRVVALAFAAATSTHASMAMGDPNGPGAPSSTATYVGLGVVSLSGATDSAWSLAQAVYAEPSLRPAAIDDATARILCGEAPSSSSTAALVDLAAAVGALRGDDAPSRILLGEIARRTSVRALVTVRIANGHPVARVFLPDTSSFDAATFAPDESSRATPAQPASETPQPPQAATPPLSWSGAVKSLVRSYSVPAVVPAPVASPAPPLATHEAPQKGSAEPHSRPFYESAWFWGSLGAAVIAGGGLYLATKDTSPSTIHLELQVH